jgi:hypothetical protein
VKRLAERGSCRPPRRGYLAKCERCGLEVNHSTATGRPVAQHEKACAAADAERVDEVVEVCKAALRNLPERLTRRALGRLREWNGS